jgi:hypothetical protein
LVVALLVVAIWVAEDALPVIGPVNDAAVMLPVLVKILEDGTYDIDVACVFSAFELLTGPAAASGPMRAFSPWSE